MTMKSLEVENLDEFFPREEECDVTHSIMYKEKEPLKKWSQHPTVTVVSTKWQTSPFQLLTNSNSFDWQSEVHNECLPPFKRCFYEQDLLLHIVLTQKSVGQTMTILFTGKELRIWNISRLFINCVSLLLEVQETCNHKLLISVYGHCGELIINR